MRQLIVLACCVAAGGAIGQPAGVVGNDPLALPKLEDLRATRERPLFAPNRRPPRVPETAQVAPAPVQTDPLTSSFELTGIVIGGKNTIAVLRNRTTKEIQRVRRGDTIENWTVAEIETRSVVLRQAGTVVELRLFERKKN